VLSVLLTRSSLDLPFCFRISRVSVFFLISPFEPRRLYRACYSHLTLSLFLSHLSCHSIHFLLYTLYSFLFLICFLNFNWISSLFLAIFGFARYFYAYLLISFSVSLSYVFNCDFKSTLVAALFIHLRFY
jgi:hypothetical protein